MTRRLSLPLLLVAACGVGGCAGLAVGAASIGGGVAVSHQLGGITYRTFTEPLPRVRAAVIVALERMAIRLAGSEGMDQGERLIAWAGNRRIEIELEALTPNTTRLRAVARKDHGLLVDSATAVEIINQVEKSFPPTESEMEARLLLSQ